MGHSDRLAEVTDSGRSMAASQLAGLDPVTFFLLSLALNLERYAYGKYGYPNHYNDSHPKKCEVSAFVGVFIHRCMKNGFNYIKVCFIGIYQTNTSNLKQ
jgi:hypothetical protein